MTTPSGRIPSVNSQVYVNYRYGVGALANSLAKGALKTIIPPPDVNIIDLSVTNDKSPIGGSDPESIDRSASPSPGPGHASATGR